METTPSHIQLIDIPKITDPRGHLAVIEKDIIPFAIKRVYYLYDVPSDAYRGGHAHKEQYEFLIALSGSFEVVLNNRFEKQIVMLITPNIGLLIPTMLWCDLVNFFSGAVCFVLVSDVFDEADYFRGYVQFKLSKS